MFDFLTEAVEITLGVADSLFSGEEIIKCVWGFFIFGIIMML